MTKQMTENNPFSKAKTRTIVYWFVLLPPLLFALFISLGILLNLPELIKSSQINFADPLFSSIAINIFVYCLILVWLFFYQVKTKFKLKYLVGELRAMRKHVRLLPIVLPMLLFSVGTAVIIFYLLYFISPETVTELANQDLLLTAEKTDYPLLYNALETVFIVIVAPITEEALFRGIFLHRWSKKWTIAKATIISSIVFGCLHFNFIGISVLGAILALTYLKTKSLLVPIAIHLLNNLIAVLLSLYGLLYASETTTIAEEIHSYWWQGAIAIIISLPWLIIFLRKNWRFTRDSLPYFANRQYLTPD